MIGENVLVGIVGGLVVVDFVVFDEDDVFDVVFVLFVFYF